MKVSEKDIYDVPDKNAIIYDSDVVSIELDNYDIVSAGSIGTDIFIKLLNQLHNKQSDFFIWYSKHKTLFKNINKQYEDLTGALYFDDDIDIIRDKIDATIKLYDKFQIKEKPVSYITNITKPSILKIQEGGNFLDFVGDTNSFIIAVVHYMTDDMNYENIIINDFLGKYVREYFINLLKIQIHEGEFGIDDDRIQQLYYNNCYASMSKFISYELIIMVKKKDMSYIRQILNNAMVNIIEDYINIAEKYPDKLKQKLDTLTNLYQEIYAGLNIANSNEVIDKSNELQNLYDIHKKEIANIFDILLNEVGDEKYFLLFDDILPEINTSINQKINEIRIEQRKKLKTTTRTLKMVKKYEQTSKTITLTDSSGIIKPDQRRVFLIKFPNKSYAIKISTHLYPGYLIEANIYKVFGQIMRDPTEQYAPIIKKTVINSYFFGNISTVSTDPQFTIYVSKEKGFHVSSTINSDLYNAIKEIASINGVNEIYYYITENVLGEWNTLDNLTLSSDEKCSILINVFKLLVYLNRKYNFIHWDLHSGNIFINRTNKNMFKIYDFDFSEIQSNYSITNINNKFFEAIGADNFKNIDRLYRNDLGLCFDIYRAFSSFSNFYPCNDVNLNTLDTWKKLAIPYIPNADQLKQNNIWLFLLVLANNVLAINYGFTIFLLQKMFVIDNIMIGGNDKFYSKYIKYKTKYLFLKKDINKID